MDEKELQEKLASGEYSISPRSGRLRKKIRKNTKKKPLYSHRKVNKLFVRVVWALLIVGFLASLFILIPEMSESNLKSKGYENTQSTQFKRPNQ
jgi:hypothetical protein